MTRRPVHDDIINPDRNWLRPGVCPRDFERSIRGVIDQKNDANLLKSRFSIVTALIADRMKTCLDLFGFVLCWDRHDNGRKHCIWQMRAQNGVVADRHANAPKLVCAKTRVNRGGSVDRPAALQATNDGSGIEGRVQKQNGPKRNATSLACVAVTFVAWASPASAQSFDCAKASFPVETAICASADLRAADETLARQFARALSNADAESSVRVRTSQRAWVLERNACAQTGADQGDCIANSYRARASALTELAAAGP